MAVVPKTGQLAPGAYSSSTGSSSQYATPIASPQMGTPLAELSRDSEKISQPKVMSGNFKLAGSLALSSLVIYAAGLVYIRECFTLCPLQRTANSLIGKTALAVWAASKTLQDEDFWIGQLCLGSGSYAIFGLLIHFAVIYRCSVVVRARNATSRSAAPASLQARLATGRKGSRNPNTAVDDSHFVSRGVWIETYVEVEEEQGEHGLGLQELHGQRASTGSAREHVVPWEVPWQHQVAIPVTMHRSHSDVEEKHTATGPYGPHP